MYKGVDNQTLLKALKPLFTHTKEMGEPENTKDTKKRKKKF